MEDRERFLSRSEMDAMSTDHEKSWQTADFEGSRRPKGQTFLAAIKEYCWLITIGLLIIIVVLQLAIWNAMSGSSSECTQQVGAEYRNLAPNFPTEVIKWKADYDFVPLNASAFLDPKVQAKWETLMPPSANVGFPEDGLVYNSTSVTHQLHCVYIMGKIFSAVMTKSSDIPEPEDYEAHFLHCVDYMRQAAMCAGDLTIEPRGENGERGPINLDNAFNGHHVCKDYSQVRTYLEEQIKEGARTILPLDD